ncbi:MAG: apolipoprotein N-acyltransferase [Pirellulaceae bacterium]|nr:MAG: apolipoprotein N-acyltransferase [Pirellulaceae bacterium]
MSRRVMRSTHPKVQATRRPRGAGEEESLPQGRGCRPVMIRPARTACAVWGSLIAGAVCYWAAFPPLSLYGLAWLAPLPWLWWLSQPHLPRRFYWATYVAGLVFWLPTLQGIRLPHPLLYVGWIALSAYLSLYWVLFAWLSRRCLVSGRWPTWVALPLVWAVCEWLRGQGPLGFSAALLAHTQLSVLPLIQVADLCGGYTLSALMLAVGTLLVNGLLYPARRIVYSLSAIALLVAASLYGWMRLASSPKGPVILRAALIQADYDTVFEFNPERNLQMFTDYLKLAQQAAHREPDLDLIIWPESTFTENNPYMVADEAVVPPPPDGLGAESWQKLWSERRRAFLDKCRYVARSTQQAADNHPGVWNLVGTEVIDFRQQPPATYNSVLLLDRQGNVRARYDKIHLVIFGEYLPFGRWFPWLYRITPLSNGVTPGKEPVAMTVGEARLAPNICFESTVPHLVGWHVHYLRRSGQAPDVLVNVTHDGWFWGSSILDLHLACSVFRAVEQRRPLLMAANPGITAWVDGNGRVVAALPRHAVRYLKADVVRDGRFGLYSYVGDLPWWGAFLLVVVWGAGIRPGKEWLVWSKHQGGA